MNSFIFGQQKIHCCIHVHRGLFLNLPLVVLIMGLNIFLITKERTMTFGTSAAGAEHSDSLKTLPPPEFCKLFLAGSISSC
jgi:hypothetical protein